MNNSNAGGLHQAKQTLPRFLASSRSQEVSSVERMELDVRITVEENVKVEYDQDLGTQRSANIALPLHG